MQRFYINLVTGLNTNDGLTPQTPKKYIRSRNRGDIYTEQYGSVSYTFKPRLFSLERVSTIPSNIYWDASWDASWLN
jgi:hypothetical protein